jgi:hypothetical protein
MRQNIVFLGYTIWGFLGPALQPAKKAKKSKQLFFSALRVGVAKIRFSDLRFFTEITYKKFF